MVRCVTKREQLYSLVCGKSDNTEVYKSDRNRDTPAEGRPRHIGDNNSLKMYELMFDSD